MKTKQEIQEADKRELEITAEFEAANKVARREFNEATKDERILFQSALDRWLAFYRPYWEVVQTRLVANGKAESEALAEVRSNWKVCPECKAPAARYQSHCTTDKCPYVFPAEASNE